MQLVDYHVKSDGNTVFKYLIVNFFMNLIPIIKGPFSLAFYNKLMVT